ncbi:hypothetical protein BT69DRAFT_28317 [Atractiella rhizophila]|nr:hypothetical protein BT69DRAFT_28317 [Atractiella rhizophila]
MEGRERVQSQTSSMGVGMASGMGMGMAGFSMDESSRREREEVEEEGWVYAPTAPISPSALAMSVDSEDEGGTFGRARGKKEKEKLNRRSGTWTIGSFFNSSQHLVSPRSSRLMNPPLTPTRPSTGDRPKPPSPASSTQTPLSPLFSSPDAGDSVFSSLPASPEFRGMQVNPKGRGSGTPGTSNWGSFGSIFGIPWLGRSALSPSNPSTPPSMSMSMDVDGYGGRRGQHVSYSMDEEEHRRRRWEKSPALLSDLE